MKNRTLSNASLRRTYLLQIINKKFGDELSNQGWKRKKYMIIELQNRVNCKKRKFEIVKLFSDRTQLKIYLDIMGFSLGKIFRSIPRMYRVYKLKYLGKVYNYS